MRMRGERRPAVLAIVAISRASSEEGGGKIEGRARASIVFPAPGLPISNMWWPPAAAISSARRAASCPRIAARSRSGSPSSVEPSAATSPVMSGSGASPFSQRTTAPTCGALCTDTPSTSMASARLPSGMIAF